LLWQMPQRQQQLQLLLRIPLYSLPFRKVYNI
jgi:hypothetical protein